MIHRGNSRNPNFGKAISLLALVGLFYFASQAVGPTKKFMGYCMTVKKQLESSLKERYGESGYAMVLNTVDALG